MRVTYYALRKRYRQLGISYKLTRFRQRWRRNETELTRAKDQVVLTDLKRAIDTAVDKGHEIVMADECCFNQKQVVKCAWAGKGDSVKPLVMIAPEPCLAVIGAISEKRGLIHYKIK